MTKTSNSQDLNSVVFIGDGEPRTMSEQLSRLNKINSEGGFEEDDFSIGGSVSDLERAIAKRLGKENAIFMPTGTLANHLAIRNHCGTGGRAVVQEQSHLFNDTGDSVQRLSGINLVPLGQGRVYFDATELEIAYQTSITGRVLNPINTVMIESPVRRQSGQVVPWDELIAITDFCRSIGLSCHLDGARIFMKSAVTGRDVRDYASLFDSVYVSLYKYFGAPFGGVLAGDQAFIEGMHHDRRMFGGGLAQVSLVASLALQGMQDFEENFAAALGKSEPLFNDINKLSGLCIEPFAHGSNIFPLTLESGVNSEVLSDTLAQSGVFIYPTADSQIVDLHVNSTVLRQSNKAILTAFKIALGKASINRM